MINLIVLEIKLNWCTVFLSTQGGISFHSAYQTVIHTEWQIPSVA